MQFAESQHALTKETAESFLLFAASGAVKDAPSFIELDQACEGDLSRQLAQAAFDGGRFSVCTLRPQGITACVVLVGLGDTETLTRPVIERAAAIAARTAGRAGARSALCVVPQFYDEAEWLSTGLGLAAGGYAFRRYKRESAATNVERVLLHAEGGVGEEAIRRLQALAEGQNLARDLVNVSPRDKKPAALAELLREHFQPLGVDVTIHDENALREMGAGGILGVGEGSQSPPRVVMLRYRGGGKGSLGLLGKGMTFDAGGLSLKTAAGMETMKSDMAGAAAVVGAITAIARLKVETAVTGVLMLAENMPSGSAMRPGDVLTMLSGKTVEVLNTDAEGRLICADGLELLRREGVACAVDLATLTGACVVALGSTRAGYLATDDVLAARLEAASHRCGERIWRMPVDEDYRRQLDSDVAEIKNVGGRRAGMITGGLFIGDFRGDLPWAHLDVAGVTFRDSAEFPYAQGGTGYGVALLTELAGPSSL